MKNYTKSHLVASFILLVFFVFSINKVSAQSDTIPKKWNFLTDVYIMLPCMNGETGIGDNISAPIDAGAGDIFSNLKMAGMLYFEAKTEKWAITADFVYMDLKQNVTPGKIIKSGEVAAT